MLIVSICKSLRETLYTPSYHHWIMASLTILPIISWCCLEISTCWMIGWGKVGRRWDIPTLWPCLTCEISTCSLCRYTVELTIVIVIILYVSVKCQVKNESTSIDSISQLHQLASFQKVDLFMLPNLSITPTPYPGHAQAAFTGPNRDQCRST